MVENFGGSLNLIIWIIATLGAGYYSYRCLFGTRGMIDQYGAGAVSYTHLTLPTILLV